jgi:hypothetical protein
MFPTYYINANTLGTLRAPTVFYLDEPTNQKQCILLGYVLVSRTVHEEILKGSRINQIQIRCGAY